MEEGMNLLLVKEYENKKNITVKHCAMFVHSEYPFLCASPGGLIGEDRLLENNAHIQLGIQTAGFPAGQTLKISCFSSL